jgi:folate-dependent phosphoribosylglycinamide formyltransferase PurN
MDQRVLIMTGNKIRHQTFAAKILERFESSYLLVEKQPEEPWGSHAKNPTSLIQEHFYGFYNAEKRLLGPYVDSRSDLLSSRTLFTVEDGQINDRETIDRIKEFSPTVMVVHSTSLLTAEFIESFKKNSIVNLHAGLSPYYRGTGTNVFPFYNKELEYVGMTLHYMDVGIDSGDIVLQGRPVFDKGDDTHSIGCKNVVLGAELMIQVIDSYLKNGAPTGHKQDLSTGHVYYKKDFTDEVVKTIRENLAAGLVDGYLEKQPIPVDITERLSYE